MPSTLSPSGPVGAELKQLHDAIVDAVRERLPQLATVAEYTATVEGGSINTPAALLDLEGFDEGADIGDGETAISCRFALHCMLSNETPRVEVECRQFAAEVVRLVRRNTWGLNFVDQPTAIAAGAAEFRPGAKGYESWSVTWEQVVYLSESAPAPGIHPFEVCHYQVQIGGEGTPLHPDEIHLPQ